jgi:hypothetical protein
LLTRYGRAYFHPQKIGEMVGFTLNGQTNMHEYRQVYTKIS